jgi:hypothetical protein
MSGIGPDVDLLGALQRSLDNALSRARAERAEREKIHPLPLHRAEAGYPNCATCDGGGCLDCTDPS